MTPEQAHKETLKILAVWVTLIALVVFFGIVFPIASGLLLVAILFCAGVWALYKTIYDSVIDPGYK